MTKPSTQSSLLGDIWANFVSLPLWVRIWTFGILVPVNAASLLFITEPDGIGIAFLANVGMLPNLYVMIQDRGLTHRMAVSHILPWTILVIWIAILLPLDASAFCTYLWILLIVDLISLGFDYPDAYRWLRSRRNAN